MNTFAHKAAFNTTKAAYATADTARSAASSAKTFGTSLLIGVKAGFAAAKLARPTPTTKLVG